MIKYELENESVIWYFSNEDFSHMFGEIDMRSVKPAIKVRGSWRETISFRPVITSGARGNDEHTGNFLIEKKMHESNDCFAIRVPKMHLKLGFANSKTIRQAAEVDFYTSPDRSITIFPSKIKQIAKDPLKNTKAKLVAETTFTNNYSNSEILSEYAKSTFIEPENLAVNTISESPIFEKIDTPTSVAQQNYDIDYAKLIIEEINSKLANDPTLIVTIGVNNKSIKMSRIVRKRVQLDSQE